jgi:hypothetical protein
LDAETRDRFLRVHAADGGLVFYGNPAAGV